jgi:hypothetical protein
MFGPEWSEGCPICSFWDDSFNGAIVHLNQRDVTMTCASRAPLAQERGVVPLGDPFERARRDEFLDAVHLLRELVFAGRPQSRELLPGGASEKESAGAEYLAEIEFVARDRPGPVRKGPPATHCSLRSVGILHHSVQGHELDDDHASHGSLLVVGVAFTTNEVRSRGQQKSGLTQS